MVVLYRRAYNPSTSLKLLLTACKVYMLEIASSLLFDVVIFLLLAGHTWRTLKSEASDIAGLPRLYRILVRDGNFHALAS